MVYLVRWFSIASDFAGSPPARLRDKYTVDPLPSCWWFLMQPPGKTPKNVCWAGYRSDQYLILPGYLWICCTSLLSIWELLCHSSILEDHRIADPKGRLNCPTNWHANAAFTALVPVCWLVNNGWSSQELAHIIVPVIKSSSSSSSSSSPMFLLDSTSLIKII